MIEEVYLLKPTTNAHLYTDCRVLRNRADYRAYPVTRVGWIYPHGQPIPTWVDSGRFPHKISRAICRYCVERWRDAC